MDSDRMKRKVLAKSAACVAFGDEPPPVRRVQEAGGVEEVQVLVLVLVLGCFDVTEDRFVVEDAEARPPPRTANSAASAIGRLHLVGDVGDEVEAKGDEGEGGGGGGGGGGGDRRGTAPEE
jgi:hypothetical protein